SHSSASSDSTTPLSLDHPLTHVSPTPTPARVSFHRKTAHMVVLTQPTLSLGMSARIAEATALSPSSFHKRYRSSYETSSSLTLPGQKRYREEDEEDESSNEDDKRENQVLDDEGHGLGDEDHGLSDESHGLEDKGLGLEEEEVVPEGQQQEVPVVETAVSEPLRLGYGALRRRELAVEEDQSTLVTWVDPEDDRVYTDVLAYAPPAAPVQTPPSSKWSLGSLPVSPSSPIVPSPIASPVATPIATISVKEDQFIEVGAQLELHGSILHDHTHRLKALLPTLVSDIDRDVRELYTRLGVVRNDMFSQRYKFRSLKREQERTVMTFGALWRLVPALKAWAGHVDTRLADSS
ncbi:hypothetical protein Tco_1534936, partial [Tanacetum coccineum]